MGARLTKPVSAADIPGADTAVAHQVPTSDGAGGFTWEDQAGGTPTTDAGDLTSGTLAAARLPGVLADVDTQIKLRNAAGAQAAATGTPNGSKYLRDDNSWQAVSATDSTKVPLAGTASMTGAIGITGSIARPSSSTINYGHTAGTTDRHYINVPSGGLIVHEVSGSSVWYSSASGNNSYQPIIFNGTQTAPSTTANASWAESPGLILQGGSGSIINQAKLTTRANSTAYSVCAYATGDVLRVHFQDGGSKRAVALVDASGTVTFEAGSHADYVASSSPASGEVGVYVTGGNLTIKPGSAGTRAIAVFVAKAKV